MAKVELRASKSTVRVRGHPERSEGPLVVFRETDERSFAALRMTIVPAEYFWRFFSAIGKRQEVRYSPAACAASPAASSRPSSFDDVGASLSSHSVARRIW